MLNFFDPFIGGGSSSSGQGGVDGKDGNGIVSIKKTSSKGLVDTYTILFTNGTTTTYEVTNGTNGKDGTNGLDGKNGLDGTDGKNGKSAYEVAQDNGFVGSESEWLESLKGKDGKNGSDGANGANGLDGKEIELRTTETMIQWKYVGDSSWNNLITLSSLRGKDGKDGTNGTNGRDGIDGNNGKEIELRNNETYIQWHYVGDTDWYNLIELEKLKGNDGIDGVDGKSAYDLAKEDGFTGTLKEWLESLKGKNGKGISSITWKSSTGGLSAGIEGATDTYEILYDDSTSTTFIVQNGSKGSKGDTGEQGENGTDGISITNTTLNDAGELIISFSDNTTKNIGKIKGEDGTSVKIKASKEECKEAGDGFIDDNGHLQIKNESGTFTDAGEIKGPAGRGIKSVSINNEGHLIIIYSDSTEGEDLGLVVGKNGKDGEKGENGKSAYEIAVDKGFEGSEVDWIKSLKGTDGRSITDVVWVSSDKGDEAGIVGAKDTYKITFSDDTEKTYIVTNGTDLNNINVEASLDALQWTNKTYTIENEGITEDNVVLIGLNKGVTKKQYEAAAQASIVVKNQNAGSIVLEAFGTVPTITIPIVLSIGLSTISSDVVLITKEEFDRLLTQDEVI